MKTKLTTKAQITNTSSLLEDYQEDLSVPHRLVGQFSSRTVVPFKKKSQVLFYLGAVWCFVVLFLLKKEFAHRDSKAVCLLYWVAFYSSLGSTTIRVSTSEPPSSGTSLGHLISPTGHRLCNFLQFLSIHLLFFLSVGIAHLSWTEYMFNMTVSSSHFSETLKQNVLILPLVSMLEQTNHESSDVLIPRGMSLDRKKKKKKKKV